MELTSEKSLLMHGLRLPVSVADRTSPLEILNNVLLQTTERGLRCSATDTQSIVSTEINAAVKKHGTITVPAKALRDFVGQLPDGEVTLRLIDQLRLLVKSGKTEFKLPGMDPKDFPQTAVAPCDTKTEVDSPSLRNFLERTVICTLDGATSAPATQAVFYHSDGTKVEVMASDGHRLGVISKDSPGPVVPNGILIHRKGVLQILKLLEGREPPVTFGFVKKSSGSPLLVVSTEDSVLSVNLMTDNPLAYDEVLRRGEGAFKFLVNRNELMTSLARVSLVGSENVVLEPAPADGQLIITANDPNGGDVYDVVAAKFEKFASKTESIHLSVKYVRELLTKIEGSEIVVECGSCRDMVSMYQLDRVYRTMVMPRV